MKIASSGAQASRPHKNDRFVSNGMACPTRLSIDRVVQNLSAVLKRTGAGKVQVTVPDRPVQLAIEQNGMDEAFASLSGAVARGSLVKIVGDLLRIETGETDGDEGCALVSVSVSGGKGVARKTIRHSLVAVRGVVKKESGLVRFWEDPGEIRVCLYLPVV